MHLKRSCGRRRAVERNSGDRSSSSVPCAQREGGRERALANDGSVPARNKSGTRWHRKK